MATYRESGFTEQLVVGGDDVLDGRAVLGLLQAKVLIRMSWLGMDAATPFSSAKRRLAAFSRFRMSGSVEALRGAVR
jgi:hypothetical protein